MDSKGYSIIGEILVSAIKKEIKNKIKDCEIIIEPYDLNFEIGVGIIKNEKRHAFGFNLNTFFKDIEKIKRFFIKRIERKRHG